MFVVHVVSMVKVDLSDCSPHGKGWTSGCDLHGLWFINLCIKSIII